jgi:hypothetical protein
MFIFCFPGFGAESLQMLTTFSNRRLILESGMPGAVANCRCRRVGIAVAGLVACFDTVKPVSRLASNPISPALA